jgi:hypothetical protein
MAMQTEKHRSPCCAEQEEKAGYAGVWSHHMLTLFSRKVKKSEKRGEKQEFRSQETLSFMIDD